MKKAIVTIGIVLMSLLCNAQYNDLVFVGSSVGLHYYGVSPDKNLHYNVGYWGTKTLYTSIRRTFDIKPLFAQIIASSIIMSVSVAKEFTDRKFEVKDIYFTGGGMILGIISINIKF
jgi:hypothetical protein